MPFLQTHGVWLSENLLRILKWTPNCIPFTLLLYKPWKNGEHKDVVQATESKNCSYLLPTYLFAWQTRKKICRGQTQFIDWLYLRFWLRNWAIGRPQSHKSESKAITSRNQKQNTCWNVFNDLMIRKNCTDYKRRTIFYSIIPTVLIITNSFHRKF